MCGSSEQMNVGHWSQKKEPTFQKLMSLFLVKVHSSAQVHCSYYEVCVWTFFTLVYFEKPWTMHAKTPSRESFLNGTALISLLLNSYCIGRLFTNVASELNKSYSFFFFRHAKFNALNEKYNLVELEWFFKKYLIVKE